MKKRKPWSYSQKIKGLLIGLLPLTWVCYQLALRPTWAAYTTYQAQQSAAADTVERGQETQLLHRARQVSTLFTNYEPDTTDQARNLLTLVTSLIRDKDVRLKEYRPLGVWTHTNLSLLTRVIRVEGGFMDCLELVYALEMQAKAGRVSSVQFTTFREGREKQQQLLCTIYIQNISNSEKE